MTSNENPKRGDKVEPTKNNSPPKPAKQSNPPAAAPSSETPADNTQVAKPQPAASEQKQETSTTALNSIPETKTTATTSTSSPPRGKKRKASAREPSNPKKHKPYTPHGTIFLWKDNAHISPQSPYQLGVPNRSSLKLKLKATSGHVYPYIYIHRNNMNWNKKEDLARAHKWRKQVLDRTLNRHRGEGPDPNKKTRPHWTEREQASVEGYIRKQIRAKRARLTHHDWQIISDNHNAAFFGKEIRIGEKTPAGKNNKGGMTKAGRVKTAHILPARTMNAIYSQAQRWPCTKQLLLDEYALLQIPVDEAADAADAKKIRSGSQGGSAEDGYSTDSDEDDDDDEEELNVIGSPIDPNLEDSSDDEEDDQRPASNQTGARLIQA